MKDYALVFRMRIVINYLRIQAQSQLTSKPVILQSSFFAGYASQVLMHSLVITPAVKAKATDVVAHLGADQKNHPACACLHA